MAKRPYNGGLILKWGASTTWGVSTMSTGGGGRMFHILVFEMLSRAKTHQSAVDHDGQSGTQSVTLRQAGNKPLIRLLNTW